MSHHAFNPILQSITALNPVLISCPTGWLITYLGGIALSKTVMHNLLQWLRGLALSELQCSEPG